MLTQKQENFANDLFLGLPECEAYEKRYDVSNMSKNAIYVEACRLAANPKIALRLEELRLPAANSNKMLVSEREDRLSEFGRETIEGKFGITRQFNISAIQELNKMDKIYSDTSIIQDNRVVNIIVSSEQAKELTEGVEEFGIFNRENDD